MIKIGIRRMRIEIINPPTASNSGRKSSWFI